MDDGRSALVVPVPEAEPVVARWRLGLDPAAAAGIPAHVTVLYPFLPLEDIDEGVITELRALLATSPAFAFHLAAVRWFGTDVVWLAPEPDQPFRSLTELVTIRWPECPPYGGTYEDVIPHLTIGDGGDRGEMVQAAGAVAGALPVAAMASEVSLLGSVGASWEVLASFALKTQPSRRGLPRVAR